jgi:hypothetical protein
MIWKAVIISRRALEPTQSNSPWINQSEIKALLLSIKSGLLQVLVD